jgi:hypothetical protein
MLSKIAVASAVALAAGAPVAGVPQKRGTRSTQKGRVSREFVDFGVVSACVYRPRLVGGGGEVVEPGWFGQRERAQDAALAGGELGALGDGALGGGEGDEVDAVQLVWGRGRRDAMTAQARRMLCGTEQASRPEPPHEFCMSSPN